MLQYIIHCLVWRTCNKKHNVLPDFLGHYLHSVIAQKCKFLEKNRCITHISHRTKTVVAAILYAPVLGTSCLLARDHAIVTRKIAAEWILITHFTNLILGTKSRAKEGRYMLRQSYAFFSIFIMNHLPQTIINSSTLKWIILSIIF